MKKIHPSIRPRIEVTADYGKRTSTVLQQGYITLKKIKELKKIKLTIS